MSARSQLADLIAAGAPDTWAIHRAPRSLAPFDDPAKPAAILIEQANITAATTSPTAAGIPVDLELWVWAMVDSSRGDDADALEDALEDVLEGMVAILAELPEHVWDGAAERTNYDEQKPAYRFTIRAAGAITPKENPS